MQTFYNGLGIATKTLIDVATHGFIMAKKYEVAYDLLEEMAANAY